MTTFVHTPGQTRQHKLITQPYSTMLATLLLQISIRLQVLHLMEFHSSLEHQNLDSTYSSQKPTMVNQLNQFQLIFVLEIMTTPHTIIITQIHLVSLQVPKSQLLLVDYVQMTLTVIVTRPGSLQLQEQLLGIYKLLVLPEMVERLWVLTRTMVQFGAHARQTPVMEPMLTQMMMELLNTFMSPQSSIHTLFLASQEETGQHSQHHAQRTQDHVLEAPQDI